MKDLFALMAIAGVATGVSSQELLQDADIELDQGSSPWGLFGNAGVNNFFGNTHLSFFADQPSNSGGAFQTGITGDAGVEYIFSLTDVRVEANANADFQFGLEFYLADDATKIGEELVFIDRADDVRLGELNGAQFSMTAFAPDGTAFVRPIIRFENGQSFGDGQENYFVFSASLQVVPAPGVGVAGLAVLGVAARRRR